jgi:hypothetical protein
MPKSELSSEYLKNSFLLLERSYENVNKLFAF